VDGSDYWEDPDEPYGGTSVRDSSPPFGELALKKCDRWCAEDLAEAWQAASVEELIGCGSLHEQLNEGFLVAREQVGADVNL
jgi:hypothetical protein